MATEPKLIPGDIVSVDMRHRMEHGKEGRILLIGCLYGDKYNQMAVVKFKGIDSHYIYYTHQLKLIKHGN